MFEQPYAVATYILVLYRLLHMRNIQNVWCFVYNSNFSQVFVFTLLPLLETYLNTHTTGKYITKYLTLALYDGQQTQKTASQLESTRNIVQGGCEEKIFILGTIYLSNLGTWDDLKSLFKMSQGQPGDVKNPYFFNNRLDGRITSIAH